MALPQTCPRRTPQEYFRIEHDAAWKSEYFDGEMFAVAGGTVVHGLIATNLAVVIKGALGPNPSRCRPYNSDVRIGILPTGLRTYPDLSVICDPIEYDPEDDENTTAINPVLIAEVLSPSTESYDRGKKFEHYQMLPSLRHYVLLSQREPKVETYFRQNDGTWLYACISGLQNRVRLEALNVELMLTDIYDGVEFGAAPELRLVERK